MTSNTAIGSAWQASCSCGWEGRRYFTKGAADVARAERWSHEIDVEDRERESSDPSTKENDR